MGDEIDPERLEDPDSHISICFSPCIHEKFEQDAACWCKYPQALFPNWTLSQQKKSKIVKVIEKTTGTCTINYVDVMKDGTFVSRPSREIGESTVDAYWGIIRRGVGFEFLSAHVVLIICSVPKMCDAGRCSSTISAGPYYRCLARGTTLSLSTSLLHSVGYLLDISLTSLMRLAIVRVSSSHSQRTTLDLPSCRHHRYADVHTTGEKPNRSKFPSEPPLC